MSSFVMIAALGCAMGAVGVRFTHHKRARILAPLGTIVCAAMLFACLAQDAPETELTSVVLILFASGLLMDHVRSQRS